MPLWAVSNLLPAADEQEEEEEDKCNRAFATYDLYTTYMIGTNQKLTLYIQCPWTEWPTGNRKKVSNSQACYQDQLCLAAA